MVLKKFLIPEQLAMAEVIRLMEDKKVDWVNFCFFSGIGSSHLREVFGENIPAALKRDNTWGKWHKYVEATVTLFVRGVKVAEVTISGRVTQFCIPGVRYDISDSWLVSKVRARKFYWKDDPEESRELINFDPYQKNEAYPCTQSEEEQADFRKALDLGLFD